MGGDRERQSQGHAARVALHRRVDELGHVGEVDDVVELPVDLLPAHPQDGAVEVDVLAARSNPDEIRCPLPADSTPAR